MFEVQYICLQSWVPVRASESSASEMVTSLLFGETCTVIGEKNDWLQIKPITTGILGMFLKAICRHLNPIQKQIGRWL